MSDNNYKLQKKLQKQQLKREKKKQESATATRLPSRPSLFVRFAESVRGILYIVLAVSMIAAVVMGQTGIIFTLEDIIDSLIIAWIGKALIVIIAIALLIYGLKNMRIMK